MRHMFTSDIIILYMVLIVIFYGVVITLPFPDSVLRHITVNPRC